MDQKDFEALMQQADQLAPAEQDAESVSAGVEVDPQALQAVAEMFSGQPQQEPQEGPAPGQSAEDFLREGTAAQRAEMTAEVQGQSLSDLDNPVEAFAGGVAKSVFETSDFLFGDTPPEERSAFRKGVEDNVEGLKEESILNGFAAGIGQFSGAMFGLGKLGAAAKAIPWAAKAASKVPSLLANSGQAAAAGAIAFDPHEERLSNLVQGTPLANPVTQWLAADPDDSAAEGRVKSALESLGMDAVLIGTFAAAGRIHKALKKGDVEAASKLVDEAQAEQAKVLEAERAEDGATVGVRGEGDGATPDAVPEGAAQSDAVPAGPQAPAAAQDAEQVVPPPGNAAGESLDVQVVDNPTQAAAQAGETLASQPTRPRVSFEVEDAGEVLRQADADREAIAKYGGWYQAVEAGHKFGTGEGINYRMMNTDADMDDLMARVVDAARERIDSIKGGKVLSDAAANKRLRDYAVAFGEDPAAVLGAVQQAGRMGPDLMARMEAGYVLAERTLRDTWRLHQLYKLGDYTQYGSAPAMRQEIAKRMSMTASLFANADSLKSNFARGMRRMQFFNDYSSLKDMDMEKVFDLLDATNGDPKKFKYLANPSVWSQLGDFAMYLRVNSLVSGPMTQLINILTNSYMIGARPMERMLGSAVPAALGDQPSRAILREAAKQYAYMGSAFTDGFSLAAKAFLKNDSVLAPHRTELWAGNAAAQDIRLPGAQAMGQGFFKPWDSTSNLLHNVLSVASVPIGLPTRALGSVDELVKQTVYRSKLMARAHVEATGLAVDAGLSGKAAKDFVKAHVQKRLDEGFDSMGRGTDPGALHEAQIATFQQDLLPNTVGKWVQTGTSNIKALRLVLPFVKTPTNVIRYGWKMTPVLNMAQREYREMILGRMGKEAQAQAVGQMSMGSLFMGAAAFMAANGLITGGGPKDPKAKQELMATGWRPYSVVTENEDGTKSYVQFGRFDPVAIPFGIIADIMDAKHALDSEEDPPEIEAAIGALGISLAKQFTSKSYLLGATQMMEAMQDPEARGAAVGGNVLSSFIPYSAAMRQLNPDEYLRETRQMTDKVLATIPGLSETVPARHDAWGEPIRNRQGLWTSSDDAILDTEMQRLALESGRVPTRPSANYNGVDLRDITLSNGKNAYEEYQRLSGRPTPRTKPLKSIITKFIQTDTYKKAPDGDQDVRGTKLWLLYRFTSKYRSAAIKVLKRDPVVREALLKETVRVRNAYKGITEEKPEQSQLGRLGAAFGINTGTN